MNEREQIAMLQTVIACMVDRAGGEVRLGMACIEDPPEVEFDDDPMTGEWIYRTVK